MKKLLICSTALALAAAFAAAASAAVSGADQWYNDPDPNATGGITGKVTSGELKEVIALEQIAYKVYRGSVNGNSYSFSRLPPGKYDLLLKLKAEVIEGLRLDVFGETAKLEQKDRDDIAELIRISDDFFHGKRIWRAGGTAKLQKLFVEQFRTKTIYNPDGSIAVGRMIRRLDYTILHKTREVWQIDPDSPRFLFREERDLTGAGSELTFYHDPALGGIRVSDIVVTAPDTAPDKKFLIPKPAAEGDADAKPKKAKTTRGKTKN